MDAKTLEALKGSIEKWRKIVEEDGEDHGGQNCPLCRLFYQISGTCRGCPVDDASGTSCDLTPWEDWLEASDAAETHSPKADTPRKLAAARAELDFLRSLLPKEEAAE